MTMMMMMMIIIIIIIINIIILTHQTNSLSRFVEHRIYSE